jgi:hypothetical protein
MPPVVSIAGPGFFFAERHPGLSFSRVVWHAAGQEEAVLHFVNGYYTAASIADSMNRRITQHG